VKTTMQLWIIRPAAISVSENSHSRCPVTSGTDRVESPPIQPADEATYSTNRCSRRYGSVVPNPLWQFDGNVDLLTSHR
jgi:hypothetical protein